MKEKQFADPPATDLELANFLAGHINHPCEDLSGNNIRNFYIREAKRAMEKFTDPAARKILAETISQYETI